MYAFAGGSDGYFPVCALLRDKSGNLYGTTQLGGTSDKGTVFELSRNGKEKVLYSFAGGDDGAQPVSGVVMDQAGNLYGTTANEGIGSGTVFKLAPDGTETVLHSFTCKKDGCGPDGALIADGTGTMYGTTGAGGHKEGVVFSISPDGDERTLYAFERGGADGASPLFGPAAQGNYLYGMTTFGGASNKGVIYRLEK